MIGYRKSTVNNYLEKKRINNLNEDNIEYVKGDFEPIISEELWTKCRALEKERLQSLGCQMVKNGAKVHNLQDCYG